MGKRRPFRGASPLEWVSIRVNPAAAALAASRENFELNLDDDEVAEIRKIDSTIQFQAIAEGVDEVGIGQMSLVMDPSYPTSSLPDTEGVQEDLETFFTHIFRLDVDFTTSGETAPQTTDNKQMDFDPPVLLASNPALLYANDADTAIVYIVRLYFTRKKAGKDDLTRILLKRR